MKKESLNYNIHDILTFKLVRTKQRELLKDLNLPFSYFEIENDIDDPDIILNIGKFTPSNDGCFIVDNKYYVKENYLYCKDLGGAAKWELEIIGLEDNKTTINFNGKHFGPEAVFYPDLLPQDILLRPIMEYKLYKKGYFFIHAAGISKDGKGYVFSGRGSSFKTSLCMDFVRKCGFGFLGDDKLIIGKDGYILSCPTHIKAFEFKINSLDYENFRESNSILNFKSIIKFLKFIKFLRNNLKYKDINITIPEASKLNALILITRTNNGIVRLRENTIEEFIKKISINNLGDIIKGHTFMLFDFGQYFYKYMLAYSFVYPDCDILKYFWCFKIDLMQVLSYIPIYEILIPQNYNSDVFLKIFEYIEGVK